MNLLPALLTLSCFSLLGAVLVPAPFLLFSVPAQAQSVEDEESETLSEADKAAIQTVIRQQLEAFQQDDAEAAFSFASPGIQDQFGSADRFVSMVKTSYAPVYRAEEAEFLESAVVRGTPAQQVRLVGPEGNTTVALYIMEKQSDDSWRIRACLLQQDQRQGIGV